LNNSEAQSVEQFNKQIAGMASGKTVALLVQRGETTLYIPIKINGK
jgi:serine protease Do